MGRSTQPRTIAQQAQTTGKARYRYPSFFELKPRRADIQGLWICDLRFRVGLVWIDHVMLNTESFRKFVKVRHPCKDAGDYIDQSDR